MSEALTDKSYTSFGTAEPIIELRDVWKIYFENTPAEVQALKGISLKIERGDFVTIMGPSGSGKSTLLTIMGGMTKPTRGDVLLDQINIAKLSQTKLSRVRKAKVGFVFQEMYLIDTLTALENVLVPLIPYGIKKADKQRAIDLLKIAGLGDRINHKPFELSGGERQRVAICRALINDAPILLADEPTGNLDTKTGHEILSLFKKINAERGTTIIVVTHDPEVATYAHKTLKMRDGKIISYENNN
ncbi:MAG: ABC transporter ATP-binding protein [Candidatus Heimdallarchaeaceae archaeon]